MNDDIIKQGEARAARNEEDPAIINSWMIGTYMHMPVHVTNMYTHF